MKERRRYMRRLVNARVKLYHSNFDGIEGGTRDISDGGVFIELDSTLPVVTGETLKMILVDSRNPNIVFNMQVMRIEPDGIGLMFVDYELDGKHGSIEELRGELDKK